MGGSEALISTVFSLAGSLASMSAKAPKRESGPSAVDIRAQEEAEARRRQAEDRRKKAEKQKEAAELEAMRLQREGGTRSTIATSGAGVLKSADVGKAQLKEKLGQ